MEKAPDKLALNPLTPKGEKKFSVKMEIILKYFSDFSKLQIEQFRMLGELYKDWNSKINLISRKDVDSLYEKHILHSLSIAAVFEFEPGTSVIDIGTGGGFPGIPLAIFFPEVKFHLVDSIAKKLKVVNAVTESIGLKNVTTQHTRVEEIRNKKPARPGGGFDYAVSRAVAPLKDLWKWSKPLLKSHKSGVRSQESGIGIPNSLPMAIGITTYDLPTGQAGSRLTITPGLICLKGGDLAKEIQESNTRPEVFDLSGIFKEIYFKDKFLLYIKSR